MTLPGILVLGSPHDRVLRDILFDMGFAPVFCKTILATMGALRRDRFLAIVVDCEKTEVDVLELILNIRDVDETIDILIYSDSEVQVLGIASCADVAVVDREELVDRLQVIADNEEAAE